jgi:hypothetical protein
MGISAITDAEIEAIKRNSVLSLPDEPSKIGYTAKQLKEMFNLCK